MRFRIREKRKNGVFPFDAILHDIIHEFDIDKSFTIEELLSKWHAIVGDILSTHSKPGRIYNNVLFVSVDHSVYGNELIMMKDAVIQRISAEFSFTVICDIKVEVKRIQW
jgi:hypothetical protein